MISSFAITKELVKNILENPFKMDWTLQGLGMLRTYLGDDHQYRLHVWNSQHSVEGVSELHTHPWDFDSIVVAGVVHNLIFSKSGSGPPHDFMRQAIHCGEGGGLKGEPTQEVLREIPIGSYREGNTYSQIANQIHRSIPEDGSVTIIKRSFKDDKDTAYVYFPVGTDWVSAEPRPATDEEVVQITQNALVRWFGSQPNTDINKTKLCGDQPYKDAMRPCVKAADHGGDHRSYDGLTWANVIGS